MNREDLIKKVDFLQDLLILVRKHGASIDSYDGQIAIISSIEIEDAHEAAESELLDLLLEEEL